MRMTKMAATLAVTSALLTSTAVAKPHLRDVAEIDDNMLWVALAVEISDQCDEIKPRTLKGLAFLNSLQSKAKRLGYSRDEIKAYVDSRAEKDRMRGRGEAYVKSKGLDPAQSDDLCSLGHAEIAAHSQIGVLLKAK
ncbi:DUF5333 domain-containing protein [Thalassobius sp. Cn5-15]|uniref:DUF5333 domain-containing protein n=1 Tax=Thalassobius sp. Cn5-15 TaxID=2917763 RepID=UPI001EF2E233|nr:DUF5333 domain-containing protein [Thalassobius sp. Cn5-15]MCG7494758.1 DUF5333 domain-containing protein [Thalassobius sp. Cn5-15]